MSRRRQVQAGQNKRSAADREQTEINDRAPHNAQPAAEIIQIRGKIGRLGQNTHSQGGEQLRRAFAEYAAANPVIGAGEQRIAHAIHNDADDIGERRERNRNGQMIENGEIDPAVSKQAKDQQRNPGEGFNADNQQLGKDVGGSHEE